MPYAENVPILFAEECSDNAGILAGHPAYLGADHHGVPAVGGGGDVFIGRAGRNRRNATKVCAVACAHVDLSTAGNNDHGGIHRARFLRLLVRRRNDSRAVIDERQLVLGSLFL